VTGTEALYADMGHFGRPALRRGWLWLVFPALVINYFAQGALLLADPTALENPFYRLSPACGLYPLVVLASAATIIASQAVISGAFSLTRQAIQLGYLPRLEVRHTSETEIGQVYVPRINSGLLVAVIVLVLFFQSSDNLGAAYGIAVSGMMLITTGLAFIYMRSRGWREFHLAAAAQNLRKLAKLPRKSPGEINARIGRTGEGRSGLCGPPGGGRCRQTRGKAGRFPASRRVYKHS
jgi:KUP system potassium uptake protein